MIGKGFTDFLPELRAWCQKKRLRYGKATTFERMAKYAHLIAGQVVVILISSEIVNQPDYVAKIDQLRANLNQHHLVVLVVMPKINAQNILTAGGGRAIMSLVEPLTPSEAIRSIEMVIKPNFKIY